MRVQRVTSAVKITLVHWITAVIAGFVLVGCGTALNSLTDITISPDGGQIRAGQTMLFEAKTSEAVLHGGRWAVAGSASEGHISEAGVYVAPSVPPSSPVTITFFYKGASTNTQITVLNAIPTITSASSGLLNTLLSNVTVSGTGFISSSKVLCNGSTVPTQYLDSTHLLAQIRLPAQNAAFMLLSVQNPDPGASTSNILSVPVRLSDLSIRSSNLSPRVGQSTQFSALSSTQSVSGGTWSVVGGSANGSISQQGLYTAPPTLPLQPPVITYSFDGATASASIQVLNPIPVLSVLNPGLITQKVSSISLVGSGFVPGSLVYIDGTAMSTQVTDSSHLAVQIGDLSVETTELSVVVQNPNPGSALSNLMNIPVKLSPLVITPTTLPIGDYSIHATYGDIPSGAKLYVNGSAITQSSADAGQITGAGWIEPWATGTATIQLRTADGAEVLAEVQEPIVTTAVSFDAAARFATQAGFGPRPDVVLHIQQVGLENFLNEQFSAPLNTFPPATMSPVRAMYLAATSGSSVLRLRTAWGFENIIPGSNFNEINNSVIPWEQTLERDVFGNYKDLLRDTASDPNIGNKLSLAGNAAPSDPGTHPNQNFGRELMQLFSLGLYMLNPDGTKQLDAQGNPIPAYTQDDVLAMSRVFTGWDYAPPANPTFTSFGIDYSQPLVSNDSKHDMGSKALFGTVTLPAGQTAVQDREAALNAIMAHPNIAPFISRLLIQRLVTGQPSPAFIARVSAVFSDNGLGVKGDLRSVFRAILLDPEARAGDTGPSNLIGFLQDPIDSQIFMMSVLQISGEDDQPTYIPKGLGEGVFDPPNIFGYFSPDFIVPGTQLNSPEYELYNNFSAIQRMQSIYGVTQTTAGGYNNSFQGWLYQHFTTVPAMVDALDHLLHHGTMLPSEKEMIINYCAGIPNSTQALETAVFLAMTSDNYTVSH